MLFCIDFDQTIVKGHFHNSLMKAKAVPNHPDNLLLIEALLDDQSMGLKNGKEMRNFISNALLRKHSVAITSYTLFPDVIIPTLRRMGLTSEEISCIQIVAFLPSDQRRGKGLHLEQAMQLSNVLDKSQVYLIDDSHNNCKLAQNAGFKVVMVPAEENASAEYLAPLLNIVNAHID